MAGSAKALAAKLQRALALHQQGQLGQAEALYREVLQAQPRHFDALHLLGVALLQRGQAESAAAFISKAIALNPADAAAHSNHGNALQVLKRHEDALASYERALTLKPDLADAHYNRGNALRALRRFDAALASYDRALAIRPAYPQALNNRGSALQDLWRPEEALASYDRALALTPDYAEALNNRGNVLRELQRPEEALLAYDRALAIRPDFAEAAYCRGNGLLDLQRNDEALASLHHALALKPDYAVALHSLGSVLMNQGRVEEAIGSYRQALALQPDFVAAHSNILFALQFCPGCDAPQILAEARRWNASHAVPRRSLVRPHANVAGTGRRIRIGYVSPYFREHCQSFFTIPLLSRHDHSNFEIYCYASVPRPDGVTERLRGFADVWRDTVRLSDAQIADVIRDDRIDILIDLTMHMGGARLLLFARKPAPVQVAWLAYPGTTGLDTMDYRLTDPFLDPPGQHDDVYSEQSIRLPDSFWCYDPLTSEPAVRPLPALATGHITFGSLNNYCKVNEGVLKLWSQVLCAVPKSRLLVLSHEGCHRSLALDFFREQGVDPGRIEWFAPDSRGNYLQAYHRIDIGLDTFPYNGHTTSLDAFWCGVPVITLVGQTVVGRAGLCQAMNLGLAELVAAIPGDYVRIAVSLAADLPRLAALRATLRQRMQASPLMDAERFARNVEASYQQMWTRWCLERKT